MHCPKRVGGRTGRLEARSVTRSALTSQRSVGDWQEGMAMAAPSHPFKACLCVWNSIQSPVGSGRSHRSVQVAGPGATAVVACFICQL